MSSLRKKSTLFDELNSYIKEKFQNDASGHDFHHVQRVIKNALIINSEEHEDEAEVILCALLHDYFDEKLYVGDMDSDFQQLMTKFSIEPYPELLTDLRNFGFKGGFETKPLSSIGLIVQDADRLDAMGAIGIARAFAYGGSKGRVLYDPELDYEPLEKKSDYRNNRPSLFHFYDKLLKLKDLMVTPKGKTMAEERHQFMIDYLKQFYHEVE